MNHAVEVWLVLIAALIAANLPFVNERLFIVGPKRVPAFAMFITFAFPGFIWRYLRRGHHE
jgi:Protein of unknown function (DUF2818)